MTLEALENKYIKHLPGIHNQQNHAGSHMLSVATQADIDQDEERSKKLEYGLSSEALRAGEHYVSVSDSLAGVKRSTEPAHIKEMLDEEGLQAELDAIVVLPEFAEMQKWQEDFTSTVNSAKRFYRGIREDQLRDLYKTDSLDLVETELDPYGIRKEYDVSMSLSPNTARGFSIDEDDIREKPKTGYVLILDGDIARQAGARAKNYLDYEDTPTSDDGDLLTFELEVISHNPIPKKAVIGVITPSGTVLSLDKKVTKHLPGVHDQQKHGTLGATQAPYVHAAPSQNLDSILREGLRQGTYLLNVPENEQMARDKMKMYTWYNDIAVDDALNQHIQAATENALLKGPITENTYVDIISLDVTNERSLDIDDELSGDDVASYVTLKTIPPTDITEVRRFRYSKEATDLLNSSYAERLKDPLMSSPRTAAMAAYHDTTKYLIDAYGLDQLHERMYVPQGTVYTEPLSVQELRMRYRRGLLTGEELASLAKDLKNKSLVSSKFIAVVVSREDKVDKHLPGMHRQLNHAGQQTPESREVDEGVFGYQVGNAANNDPRSAVYRVTKITGKLPSDSRVIVDMDWGEVHYSKDLIHESITGAAGKQIDRQVRFYCWEGNLGCYTAEAGVAPDVTSGYRQLDKEEELYALDNIFNALDSLVDLGLDPKTKVSIGKVNRDVLSVVAKHLPGQHRQLNHAGAQRLPVEVQTFGHPSWIEGSISAKAPKYGPEFSEKNADGEKGFNVLHRPGVGWIWSPNVFNEHANVLHDALGPLEPFDSWTKATYQNKPGQSPTFGFDGGRISDEVKEEDSFSYFDRLADELLAQGWPGETIISVYPADSMVGIDFTIEKHLPGVHDQQRHAGKVRIDTEKRTGYKYPVYTGFETSEIHRGLPNYLVGPNGFVSRTGEPDENYSLPDHFFDDVNDYNRRPSSVYNTTGTASVNSILARMKDILGIVADVRGIQVYNKLEDFRNEYHRLTGIEAPELSRAVALRYLADHGGMDADLILMYSNGPYLIAHELAHVAFSAVDRSPYALNGFENAQTHQPGWNFPSKYASKDAVEYIAELAAMYVMDPTNAEKYFPNEIDYLKKLAVAAKYKQPAYLKSKIVSITVYPYPGVSFDVNPNDIEEKHLPGIHDQQKHAGKAAYSKDEVTSKMVALGWQVDAKPEYTRSDDTDKAPWVVTFTRKKKKAIIYPVGNALRAASYNVVKGKVYDAMKDESIGEKIVSGKISMDEIKTYTDALGVEDKTITNLSELEIKHLPGIHDQQRHAGHYVSSDAEHPIGVAEGKIQLEPNFFTADPRPDTVSTPTGKISVNQAIDMIKYRLGVEVNFSTVKLFDDRRKVIAEYEKSTGLRELRLDAFVSRNPRTEEVKFYAHDKASAAAVFHEVCHAAFVGVDMGAAAFQLYNLANAGKLKFPSKYAKESPQEYLAELGAAYLSDPFGCEKNFSMETKMLLRVAEMARAHQTYKSETVEITYYPYPGKVITVAAPKERKEFIKHLPGMHSQEKHAGRTVRTTQAHIERLQAELKGSGIIMRVHGIDEAPAVPAPNYDRDNKIVNIGVWNTPSEAAHEVGHALTGKQETTMANEIVAWVEAYKRFGKEPWFTMERSAIPERLAMLNEADRKAIWPAVPAELRQLKLAKHLPGVHNQMNHAGDTMARQTGLKQVATVKNVPIYKVSHGGLRFIKANSPESVPLKILIDVKTSDVYVWRSENFAHHEEAIKTLGITNEKTLVRLETAYVGGNTRNSYVPAVTAITTEAAAYDEVAKKVDTCTAFENIYRAFDIMTAYGADPKMPASIVDYSNPPGPGNPMRLIPIGKARTIKHLPGIHDQQKHAGIEHATTSAAIADVRKNGLKAGSYVIDTDYNRGLYDDVHHAAVLENMLAREGRLSKESKVYIVDLDVSREYLENQADRDDEFEDDVSFVLKEQIPPSRIKSIAIMRPSDALLERQEEVSLDDFIRELPRNEVLRGFTDIYGMSNEYVSGLLENAGVEAAERRVAAKNYVEFLTIYDLLRKKGNVTSFGDYLIKYNRKYALEKFMYRNGFELESKAHEKEYRALSGKLLEDGLRDADRAQLADYLQPA